MLCAVLLVSYHISSVEIITKECTIHSVNVCFIEMLWRIMSRKLLEKKIEISRRLLGEVELSVRETRKEKDTI
jgi:hypothetical protein